MIDSFRHDMNIQITSFVKYSKIKYAHILAGIRYLEMLSNCTHLKTPAILRGFFNITGSVVRVSRLGVCALH